MGLQSWCACCLTCQAPLQKTAEPKLNGNDRRYTCGIDPDPSIQNSRVEIDWLFILEEKILARNTLVSTVRDSKIINPLQRMAVVAKIISYVHVQHPKITNSEPKCCKCSLSGKASNRQTNFKNNSLCSRYRTPNCLAFWYVFKTTWVIIVVYEK